MEVIGIRRDKPWIAIVSYRIPTGILKGLHMVTEVGVTANKWIDAEVY